MMPLPWVAGSPLTWRLDLQSHGSTWDGGIGSAKVGGRWHPVGYTVVYCSADPATAILEVAVHKGFAVLDTVRHVLTRARIRDVMDVQVVMPEDVPNLEWLRPGSPSRGQQAFGRELLEQHVFVVIPSTVTQRELEPLVQPRSRGRTIRAGNAEAIRARYAPQSTRAIARQSRIAGGKTSSVDFHEHRLRNQARQEQTAAYAGVGIALAPAHQCRSLPARLSRMIMARH